MRVSLEPTDPDFVPNATHIDAYVNNELIVGCRTVDEEGGYVLVGRALKKLKGKVMLAGMPYRKQVQTSYQDLPSNRD